MMRNLEIALMVVMSFVAAVRVAWVILFVVSVLLEEEVACVCFLIVLVNA